MAEVTLAGLVKESVSDVACMARNLLPGAVLALDAVTTQMAPLQASFATLNPGYLSDLGQSSSLCSCSTAHPGGQSGAGGGRSSWFSYSAAGGEKHQRVAVCYTGKKLEVEALSEGVTFLTLRCLPG